MTADLQQIRSDVPPREKIRIAIDGRPALWPRTGIGTIAHNVLKRIARFDPDNSYYFYFDRRPDCSELELGAARFRYGGPLQKLAWANTFLPIQFRRDHIDVYLSFLDKEIPVFRGGTKYVSMVHDLIPLLFPDTVFRNLAHKLYYTGLLRASTSLSDLVLTNSDHSKQALVANLGLAPEKVRTIRLGAEEAPHADPARISEALGKYSIRRPYIFALGSTEPRKNNNSVIRAFQKVRGRFPQLQLAIAGRQWRGRQFDCALLDSQIVQTGFVADEDMPILFGAAEVFVFPSFHEGFGVPVIEAMAQGVPVITSNVSALPEVAGDAALLCDPASVESIAAAMEQILKDCDLAECLRDRGIRRAKTFQWDNTCTDIVAVCSQVAAAHVAAGGEQ